ncbi:MAG: hypothetical protein EBX50_05480 [Chitinophagia bacterium]|nr:hypothetical protein [Chitinophagia bacterium]
MRKITLRIIPALLAVAMFVSCEKEYSLENGGFSMTAMGTLLDSLGNCKQIIVNGSYNVDVNLTSANFVQANVNFTSTGKYKIYSDTVNGMWFQDSGFITSSGAQKVSIRGYGKPILPKSSDFILNFNGTGCTFNVSVSVSGGSGGGGSDYFPTTKASNWTYRYSPSIGNIDTFRVEALVDSFKIDSLMYYQFARSLGDTFYFAKNSAIGNYYALSTIDFDYAFIFDSVPQLLITYPFLKERALVNESWETQEYGTVKLTTAGVTEYGVTKASFTIISKNTVPYTVGGSTYQNVIAVGRKILFKPTNGTSFRTILTGTSYYAKGFGLIDQVLGTSPSTQSISLIRLPTIY